MIIDVKNRNVSLKNTKKKKNMGLKNHKTSIKIEFLK